MKKLITIIAAIAFAATFATAAFANDVILAGKVGACKIAKTKKGDNYVRLTIEVPKALNGVHYESGETVMCFGPTADKAKTIKAGQTVKLVASEQEYKGHKSYLLIDIVQ